MHMLPCKARLAFYLSRSIALSYLDQGQRTFSFFFLHVGCVHGLMQDSNGYFFVLGIEHMPLGPEFLSFFDNLRKWQFAN